jgi:aerobic carbon-monoxide dehydrogenase medium subunit
VARLAMPSTVEEACALLADADGDAVVLGGGTALQMLRRRGEFDCETLVDLARVPGLDAIERASGGLSIGARATHRRVELDPLVRETAPVLCDVAAGIANVRVRNAATIGGNLAHADYRLDPPGALLVLGATLEIASRAGTREVPIGDLFGGQPGQKPGQKALAVDDVLVRVHVPAPPAGARLLFAKYKSLGANDWPCAAVAAMAVDGRLALGITAAAPAPVHLELDASGLDASGAVDAADAATDEAIDPISDLRGGASFKRRVTRVLVRDTVARLWEEGAA